MLKNYGKCLFVLLLLVFLFMSCTSSCTSTKENGTEIDERKIFTRNSAGPRPLPGSHYLYEMWSAAGNDNRLIWYGPNKGGGAAFRAEWNNANTFLGRVGLQWNQQRPYTYYGNLFCDYEFTRSPNGTAGGWSYIGIYGWSRNPLVEWYIVDDWFGNGIIGPENMGGGAAKVGEFEVDGATYFIYLATRNNQPSIDGTRTFKQFFSIRQERRQSGTISITEHFKEWEKIGLKLGSNMYEAKFLVEAGGSTGWMDASYVRFYRED
ncbi:MAG: glycoside hydrolase family 11 protein [Bacteroidales bacterium]|jgi:endo-1,4-beta-xylanase|nr:glycoside hydrolase family 11 protein [Bacteroidales bacterium]